MSEAIQASIQKLKSEIRNQKLEIKSGELLARFTTSRLGGPADILIEVSSADELKEVVIAARKVELSVTVLGSGANVLVSDAGVRGLTIINRAKRTDFRDNRQVWCESGTTLPALARECIARGLSGLEWAVGVPGTVGGAVVGNAGAHGRDTAANLLSATILIERGRIEEWSNTSLEFSYRSSRIKSEIRNRKQLLYAGTQLVAGTGRTPEPVVLAATFQLIPGDPAEIEKTVAAYNEYRRRTQPPGASIGSMFKNPPGNAAGRLIDQCGLKGASIGDAEISTVHANFFVNHGHAKAVDVQALIDLARKSVLEKFGIEMELEVELIGEW